MREILTEKFSEGFITFKNYADFNDYCLVVIAEMVAENYDLKEVAYVAEWMNEIRPEVEEVEPNEVVDVDFINKEVIFNPNDYGKYELL